MNTKLFGLLLVVVAIVLGVAALSLFDDPSNSNDTPKTPTGVPATNPTPKQPTPGPEVASTGRSPVETENPVRTEQSGAEAFSPRGKLTVRGKVTSKGTRDALAGASVKVCDEEGETIDEGETRPDGSYEIVVNGAVPPKIDVVALAEGYAATHSVNEVGAGDVREMTVDLELLAEFFIEGRVIDLATGQPVAEAEVNLSSSQIAFSEAWDSAESDASGFYKLGPISEVPRDGFDLALDASDYAPQLKRNLKLENGQNTLHVDFQLYATLKIKGRVISLVTGKPISEAVVNGQSSDEEFVDLGESESTEEDGTFVLELSSSPYEGLFLLATADDHSAVLIDQIPAPGVDGSIDVGTISMPPLVTLRGTVVNALTGVPVGGGDVTVYSKAITNGEESDYTDNEEIDANGAFEVKLANSTPVACEILVEANGAVAQRQSIAVPPNTPVFDVRIEVQPTIQFTGVVTRQADGTPVIGAIVRVRAGRSSPLTTRCDAQGRFKVELPPAIDLDQTEVTVHVLDKKFNLGPVPNPGPKGFETTKNYSVDAPALRR